MAVSNTPFMDTVVTTTASTPYSLQTLLAALPAARQPSALTNPSGVLRAAYIQLQADPAGGSVKYYIGSSSTMTTTVSCGVVLFATQSWSPPNAGGNLYRLDQIFLMADGASAVWYVSFVTR